jgi:hypothetical protein
MLLVAETAPGSFELCWTWLPTWIGLNTDLKRQLEAHIKKKFIGNEATIEDLHNEVVEHLVLKFNAIAGLKEYLKAVEGVVINPEANEH